MAITVTATQVSATSNGMLLRVMVLTGTAATQNGATASAAATCSTSVTTTVTGSRVYGAVTNGSGVAAVSGCTLIDNFNDSTNSETYGSFRTTSATGTPGATTVGATGGDTFGDVAAVEILPSGTVTEDASGPAVATTMTAVTVTTASFTPPPGALLVALIGSDGAANGSSVTTMTVSGGGLTWSEAAHGATATSCYAGVWLARVPSAATDLASVQPGPVWLDLFKPAMLRPRPFLPSLSAVPSESGALSITLPAPVVSLTGLDTLTLDQPQAQPGPVWLDLFKPGQQKPRPVPPAFAPASEQGAFSITLPVPATALTGLDTLPLSQPQVQPGPVWLDLFKPALPKSRPVAPAFAPPAEQGTFSIVLPLPLLSLSGLDTLTLDQPQAQPGPVWLDLFKPALPKSRPVPPALAPANEQGTLSITLPVPATALSGLDTLTTDQPGIQPGSTWTDLFKPGLPRPRPVTVQTYSVAGELGALSIVLPLPLLSLTGLDTLLLSQPQVQPGATWTDLFKPGLPRVRPVPPAFAPPGEQGALGIVLPVPVTSLTGTDQPSAVPGPGTVTPGPQWLTLFKPGLPKRPVPLPPFIPGLTESGAFIIVLPPGQRDQAETGDLALPLPSPATALSATVAHDGYFAPVLPVPATSLTGLTPVNEQGALAVPLPVPSLVLSGLNGHAGNLNISFAVPPPHMSWHAFFMTSDTAGLTRYELFGAESQVTTAVALPVPVTLLAAQLPDAPGTRSYFRGGRWISAQVPERGNLCTSCAAPSSSGRRRTRPCTVTHLVTRP